jgi:hypothetical protein
MNRSKFGRNLLPSFEILTMGKIKSFLKFDLPFDGTIKEVDESYS